MRFTTNAVCANTYTHVYVARTSEDLSPFMYNVCEFLGNNYCIPKRWPIGSLQQSLPPLAQISSYATAWEHVRTAFPHLFFLALYLWSKLINTKFARMPTNRKTQQAQVMHFWKAFGHKTRFSRSRWLEANSLSYAWSKIVFFSAQIFICMGMLQCSRR